MKTQKEKRRQLQLPADRRPRKIGLPESGSPIVNLSCFTLCENMEIGSGFLQPFVTDGPFGQLFQAHQINSSLVGLQSR
jgi:hypothetical protein